ncbi:hypothetical protein LP420_02385 [Massilia sp. B-10]|nr:hypothetical protein LP420_02385 [Massilia sp. B-10]UUZ54852.1 hypothetical protein LP419_02235 [Massilia sp. H-1]
MIDDKFSATAFAAAGQGTPEARALSQLLQAQLQAEAEPFIGAAMNTIVEKLNAMGHRLKPYGPQAPGEKHFHEYPDSEDKNYKFLVALDLVITVGYPETTDEIFP